MENPIKIDDLGVPLFLETPICLFGGWTKFQKYSPKMVVGFMVRFIPWDRIRKQITEKTNPSRAVSSFDHP